MMTMSDEEFSAVIRQAMTELSPDHMAELEHVAILVAGDPSPEQVEKLNLRGDSLLLGLYEGVPRTSRSGYESGLMPDTITIFKNPLMAITSNEPELYEQIKRTVWHEIAHYFGISHEQMDKLQTKDIDK
jgi:predicted Zn-dependent protease with MMP-like domain